MSIPTEFSGSSFQDMDLQFSQAAVAASQAQVALKVNVNDATSGSLNITGIPAQWPGSLTGISAVLTANKTAGVFGVSPTVAGTEVGSTSPLYRAAIANSAKQVVKNCDAQLPGHRFNQGDLLGVKITTDGSYAPTTSDLLVILTVTYEEIRH
jgi:hypothetical protein